MAGEKKNIHQRVIAAMDLLNGKVAKDSRQGHQGFNYVSIAALTNTVRRVFTEVGITFRANLVAEDRTTKALHQAYECVFTNADNPEDFFSVVSVGSAMDQKPTSAGVAMSYAVKNAILKCLMLAGDDKDAEVAGTEAPAGKVAKPNAANESTKKVTAKDISDENGIYWVDTDGGKFVTDQKSIVDLVKVGEEQTFKFAVTPKGNLALVGVA